MMYLHNNIHSCEFPQWMEHGDIQLEERMSRLWKDESHSKEQDTSPRAGYTIYGQIHLDRLGVMVSVTR